MPRFGKTSLDNLATADSRLQDIFNEVIKHFDCTIVCGYRNKKEQDKAVAAGASKTPWPTSKHNKSPSLAVDAIPYPIKWGDKEGMTYFAGFVKGIAASKGISIRWGGDWGKDNNLSNEAWDDLPHFELD